MFSKITSIKNNHKKKKKKMKSAYMCHADSERNFQSADLTLSGPRGKPHVKLIYAGELLDADKTVLKPIKLNDNS